MSLIHLVNEKFSKYIGYTISIFYITFLRARIIQENEKSDTNLDLAREVKTMEHESDGDINCN